MAVGRLYSLLQATVMIGTIIGLIAVTAGCSKPPTAQVKISIIDDYDEAWRPSETIIAAGGTVTWTNNGHIPHAIISNQNLWSNASVSPGDSFKFKFTKPGNFSYHDETDTYTNSVVVK